MAYALFARWEQDDDTLVFGPYPERGDAMAGMRELLASNGVEEPEFESPPGSDEIVWSDGDGTVWIAPMQTFKQWMAAQK